MSWKTVLILLIPLVACATPSEGVQEAEATPQELQTVQVVDLQYAEAPHLAMALQQTLTTGGPGQLRVAPDPRTNRLIVAGSPEAVAQAVEVIARLDRTEPQHAVVLRLEHVQAPELANVLQRLMREPMIMSYGQDCLLVAGSDDALGRLRTLIAELDRPVKEG